MLSVYTRHYPPCTHTDINHRRCRCPKWIQGTLDDGRLIRQSANTRNWEKAELTARDLEDAANPHKPTARARMTIADAIQCFRDDEKSYLSNSEDPDNCSEGSVRRQSVARGK